MLYLQKLVNEKKALLTKSEQLVGQYIILNAKENELDLKVISCNCNVSITTVIRFCKKLGFQGFKEFQIYIAVNSERSNFVKKVPSLEMIRQDIYDNVSRSLRNIDFNIIDQIVALINQTNKVFVYGLSSSRYICEDFVRKLLIMGINSECLYEEEMIYLASKRIKKDDIIVVVSLSGNNELLANASQLAILKEGKVISLTNNTSNKCASIAQYRLYVDVDELSIMQNRYRPRYIFMIIMEVIINELLNLRALL
ncbi:MAG: MurR/RpiR family transcriptional regulator [Bacilli bacterium]